MSLRSTNIAKIRGGDFDVLIVGGEEADLLEVRGVRLDEPISRHAEMADQWDLVVLQILKAAPHQVRRLHRGEPCEVAAIDHGNTSASRGQRRGADCTVDAAAAIQSFC